MNGANAARKGELWALFEIARGLLKIEDRADWWAVVQACYAAQLSDVALDWLTHGGVITREQRGDAVAILDRISNWWNSGLIGRIPFADLGAGGNSAWVDPAIELNRVL